MFRRFCFAIVVFAFAAIAQSVDASSSRVRKADKILRKHVAARGGSSAIRDLRAMRVNGRIEQQGLELAFDLWMKRPNLSRMDLALRGQDVIQAFDRQTAWWVNPFFGAPKPQPMPDHLAKSVIRWSDFDGPLINHKKKRNVVEYFGEEISDVGTVLKLRVTKRDGEVWNVYLDATSYLELKRSFIETTGDRAHEVITYFEDYTEVMGVMVPRIIEGEGLHGQRYTMYFDSFEPNPDIDDGRFQMKSPDEQ